MAGPWPREARTEVSQQGRGPGAYQRNGGNCSARPTVPSSGLAACRTFGQAHLPDERVLSGVVVIPAAAAAHTEPRRLLEGARPRVGGADLEDGEPGRTPAGGVVG